MPERTAAQEYEWLISREEHRKPIDAFFADAIAQIAIEDDANVLELGPGPCDDLWRVLFEKGISVIQADTRPARVNVIPLEPQWSDSSTLPWPEAMFTDVLAREVFEHVFHLREMIAEVYRVLTPGGTLWFTTPFMYLLHDVELENGGDFNRLSPTAYARLLGEVGFADVDVRGERFLFGSWQCPISVLGRAQK